MANKANWPTLGLQPPNHLEHATQIIAEATALLELDNTQRKKLPDHLFEVFINSILTYTKKSREQPSPHKILGKLNQLHHLTMNTHEGVTLIKNAVNSATVHPGARVATWADRVRSPQIMAVRQLKSG